MTEKKEAELRELATSFELHRTQLEQLIRQEEILRLSLEENLRAKETMVRLRDCKDDSELLIPIGANNFIFGKLGDKTKIIMGIGSEVTVEVTIEEALERIELKVKELSDARDKIGERRVELNNKVVELSAKLQKAYEESQKIESKQS